MVDVGTTPVIQTGNGYGCDGMGGNWIWAFLLFALLGRNGFGYGDNGREAGIERSIYNSQNFTQLDNGVRSIQNGLCDLTFSLNNSIKDGFYSNAMGIQGVNTNLGNAICNQTYELNNQIRNLGERLSDCCCTTQRAIDGVNFNNERNTNAIIQSQERGNQRIIDWLNAEKLSNRDQKIFEMSQREQTREIIAAQKPQAPVPAYIQPSPFEVYYPSAYGYGRNFGGGCNTGCCA